MLYNNSGYFLLGYIISKVSGKSYENFLKETFFDPLKMENTGVHYAGIKLTNFISRPFWYRMASLISPLSLLTNLIFASTIFQKNSSSLSGNISNFG